VSGIFLAPFSNWQTKGTWNGELIGGLHGMITVMSGTTINAPPPVTEVPITNSAGTIIAVAIIGGGLAILMWRSRRRSRVA
jgi:hypothetical protein